MFSRESLEKAVVHKLNSSTLGLLMLASFFCRLAAALFIVIPEECAFQVLVIDIFNEFDPNLLNSNLLNYVDKEAVSKLNLSPVELRKRIIRKFLDSLEQDPKNKPEVVRFLLFAYQGHGEFVLNSFQSVSGDLRCVSTVELSRAVDTISFDINKTNDERRIMLVLNIDPKR